MCFDLWRTSNCKLLHLTAARQPQHKEKQLPTASNSRHTQARPPTAISLEANMLLAFAEVAGSWFLDTLNLPEPFCLFADAVLGEPSLRQELPDRPWRGSEPSLRFLLFQMSRTDSEGLPSKVRSIAYLTARAPKLLPLALGAQVQGSLRLCCGPFIIPNVVVPVWR